VEITDVAVRIVVQYNFLISNVNGKPEHHKQANVEQNVARVIGHSYVHTVTLLDVAAA